MIGSRLSHFEILEKIGAGGMGEVYRARDAKLGREVALKVLPAEVAADPDRVRRFMNEARAVAALNHPHIVTIYSVEQDAGVHFLTMELIRGDALHKLIPKKGYDAGRFFEIALSLTDALSAAHELGVIHRDLKPSNLMQGSDGRVKILDFGLATVVRSENTPEGFEDTRTQMTGAGIMVGTMPYMSPEQIESKPVDARSDLFSFGIILYEMATGQRPFHGDTGPALISSILKDVPPPVTHLNPEMLGEVGLVIARCLEKAPEKRFQSARELQDALAALRDAAKSSQVGAARPSELSDPGSSLDPSVFHDIFISYAHLDNEAQLAGQEGWVTAFHRSLEVRVGQLLGKKPTIWRDPRGNGDDAPAEKQVPDSALLITVLSPRYVKSELCAREVQEFVSSSSRTGGPKWGSKYRIFKVVKTPTPLERHPAAIQPLLGYEFFKVDPQTGRERELDQIFGPEAQRDYWARLDDLAHDIVDLLENAPSEASSPSVRDESSGYVSSPSSMAGQKGYVYLAQTTYDLKSEHDALRRDLQRHGYGILPDQPLPLIGEELKSFVREQLERCKMSIHLLGRNYGIVPEGEESSVVALQNALAADRTESGEFGRLIWIPLGFDTSDERQRQFIERIRTNPRMQEGSDLLETSFEDLKTVVRQTLEPPARHSEPRVSAPADDQVRRVYLICDQRDEGSTNPLADFLFDSGFEVTLPVFEGDEAEVREDHEDNLRVCDGVLVYYGSGNELWLRRKLREVQKSPGLGRTRSLLAKGIWVAPPVTPQKSRLRTREALIMSQTETFSTEPLRPFVEALGGNG